MAGLGLLHRVHRERADGVGHAVVVRAMSIMGTSSPRREDGATAAVEVCAFMGTCPDGRWIARGAAESM